MSKKIKNEETKIKRDKNINDSDILNDTLLSIKFLVDNFAIGLNEASNKWIYEHFKKAFDELSTAQQNLFQLSFEKGWYILEEADKTKINEAIKQNGKKIKELNVHKV